MNKSEINIISQSSFFDETWYRKTYSIPKTEDATMHYLNKGWKLNYDPSQTFSTSQYLSNNDDVAIAGINPLLHYETYGKDELDRLPVISYRDIILQSAFFDETWYIKTYSIPKTEDTAMHYLNKGWKLNYDPSLLFSTSQYLSNNDDVAETEINPLLHYETYGKDENNRLPTILNRDIISQSSFFDETWYRKTYSIPKKEDAAFHYLNKGWRSNYDPSLSFSTSQYLSNNDDVAKAEINPLLHYETYRKDELDRLPAISYRDIILQSAFFDKTWYRKTYSIPKTEDAAFHYLNKGWRSNHDPSLLFSTSQYLSNNDDAVKTEINPLLHFEICKTKIVQSPFFDDYWYRTMYYIPQNENTAVHYLNEGWKLNYNPSPLFSTSHYLLDNEDVAKMGINPLLHYEKYGKKEDNRLTTIYDREIISKSVFFDDLWYRKTYSIPETEDSAMHYLNEGWKLNYNPSLAFSTIAYLLHNSDVAKADVNPLLHYEVWGDSDLHNNHDRIFKEDKPAKGFGEMNNNISIHKNEQQLEIEQQIQNKKITEQFDKKTKKLVVLLLPEIDVIGGGVMSICSIGRVMRSLPEMKRYDFIVATVPSVHTFSRYTSFDAGFDIFRFEQMCEYFNEIKKIIVYVPEVFVDRLWMKMSVKSQEWLRRIKHIEINILNQNMQFMPSPSIVDIYRNLADKWTMTCAHQKYCTRHLRTSYNMSVSMLSTSNLTKYEHRPYSKKKNLLVYSNDSNYYKEFVLNKIKVELPDLECKEIKDMKYSEYLDIIAQAKWMITFGEGVDGYFLESARSGTIPFAARNNIFFDKRFDGLETVYDSYDQMLDNIVIDIIRLDDEKTYNKANLNLCELDSHMYNDKEYKENIRQYCLGNYTFPIDPMLKIRKKLLAEKPLVSIVMATYNGEKFLLEQLKSLNKLTWSNLELIISDDGSTDKTLQILKEFKFTIPVKLLSNKGKHGLLHNFTNALQDVKGKYIALCDQDDIWKPNKIEILLEGIDDFDIVLGNMTVIDEYGNYHPEGFMHDAYETDHTMHHDFIDSIPQSHMLGCATLISSDLIKKAMPIPEGFLYHDWWFALYAMKFGKGLCFLDKSVIQYRQHQSNTAKLTFDDVSWCGNKMKSNNIIIKEFGKELLHEEIITIECDNNRLKLLSHFRKYMPHHLIDSILNTYLYSFTNKTMNELQNCIVNDKPICNLPTKDLRTPRSTKEENE